VTFLQQVSIVIIDKLLIGGLLLLGGFWINRALRVIEWQQAIRKEVMLAENKAAMDQLAAQIRELYSPLYGMLQESEDIFRVAMEKLPNFKATHRLSEKEWPVWRYFVETYFLPGNARMAALIRSKIYLVQGNELPESWKLFLAHQTHFEILDKLWRDKQEPSPELHGAGWPDGFNEDVRRTFYGANTSRMLTVSSQL
jgi:hypothetical protein